MCEGLVAHQSQPGRLEEEKQKFLSLPSIETKSPGPSSPQPIWKELQVYNVTIDTDAFRGHAVAQMVQALRYKSEGRGFDSRWCHWISFLPAALWSWG